VQGGGSAAGTTAIALAKRYGLRVIATTRSAEKRAALERLGVLAVLDWRESDFRERVFELTDGAGVDAAIDNMGSSDMFLTTLSVLAPRGRLVVSGAFLAVRPRFPCRICIPRASGSSASVRPMLLALHVPGKRWRPGCAPSSPTPPAVRRGGRCA